MSNLAIKAENISKQYRLGEVGTGTLSHDLARVWAKIRGKEDPFLKIGEENNRVEKGESQYVWSLKDINFEIEQGDAVGIIGRNGAGKSTLLKLLSKITKPTTGNIYLNGRVASLLEVGTGFQPMMTGRENIYLNGAILGMNRKEITRKFDEIVDFSGVERYIDTPVKRYSSGMYVRLAFAVAAHLESEILIIDEVLAVGDAEFQKKCLGKMGDISHNDGRTVLFVSHNIGAVNSLCNKGIVLDRGNLIFEGEIKNAVDSYVNSGIATNNHYISESTNGNDIKEIQILNSKQQPTSNFYFNEDIVIKLLLETIEPKKEEIEVGIRIIDQKERVVFTTQKSLSLFEEEFSSRYTVNCIIPKQILVPNSYKLLVALHIPNVKVLSLKEEVVSFVIEETGTDFYLYNGNDYGCVFVDCEWKIAN